MGKHRLYGCPARRRRSRLPALENAAAYFHAAVIHRVEKERHALLDDRVSSRESPSERLVEMGRRGGRQIDCEHRRIFLSKALQQSPGPVALSVRIHQRLEALSRASIVLDETEKAKRVHELSAHDS